MGNVKTPAIYELKGKGRISDLLALAGGLSSTGFKGRVQIYRVQDNQYRSILEGDLEELQIPSKNFALSDGDVVRVFSVTERQNVVTLTGPVARPGSYGIQTGVTRLRDVLLRAGGVLFFASDEAELTRVRVTQSGPETERLHVNLKQALSGDPSHNILLEVNDYLFVREVPEWDLYKTVRIEGEVRYPGTYTVHRGETLASLLSRAGGYAKDAYLAGAVFLRRSVAKLQQEQNQTMVDQMERELLAVGANEMSAATTADEAKQAQAAVEQKRRLLDSMKQLKAQGRLVVRLDEPSRMKGTPWDLQMEDGDVLRIPRNPQTVQVMGSVLNPTSFVYRPGTTVMDYIRQSGGFAADASPGRIYLVKMDGTAARLDTGSGGLFGKKGPVVRLDPGDAIVVPMKVNTYAGFKQTRDWIDIIFKIAMSAAAINNMK